MACQVSRDFRTVNQYNELDEKDLLTDATVVGGQTWRHWKRGILGKAQLQNICKTSKYKGLSIDERELLDLMIDA